MYQFLWIYQIWWNDFIQSWTNNSSNIGGQKLLRLLGTIIIIFSYDLLCWATA